MPTVHNRRRHRNVAQSLKKERQQRCDTCKNRLRPDLEDQPAHHQVRGLSFVNLCKIDPLFNKNIARNNFSCILSISHWFNIQSPEDATYLEVRCIISIKKPRYFIREETIMMDFSTFAPSFSPHASNAAADVARILDTTVN